LAWVLHTLELVLIVVENKRPPLLSLYETAIFLTWVLILNYLLWEMLMKAQGVGTFLIPVTFGLLVGALLLPRTEPNLALTGGTSGALVGWHIAVSLGAYGLLLMSFVTAAAYLFQAKQLRDKAFRPIYYRLPPLEALDRWSLRFVQIGFPLLTVGLVSGLVLARLEWQNWTLDPKILWSFLSWVIYGGYLAMRYRWGWAGRRAAFWSVVGFSTLVANYFLINLFATELHRWGLK
jgi:ABC-type uncharacterized transport system permease subunit